MDWDLFFKIAKAISTFFIQAGQTFAWPLIAWLVVLTFKDEFSGILSRLRGVSAGSLSVDMDPKEAINQQSKFQEIDESVLVLPNAPIMQHDDELEAVKRELDFERIYNAIFGSQIILLEKMNIEVVVTKTAIEEILKEVKEKNPSFGWTVDHYLAFLLNQSLIDELDGDRYQITQKAKDFLMYLTKMGYRKDRPL